MLIFAPVINQLKNQCYEKDYYTPKVTDGDRFYRMEPIGFCTSVQNRPQQGLFRQGAPHADARSFVDLGHGYAKDRNNVYHHGRILELVDPATFRLKGRDNSHFHEEGDWHEHDRSPKGYYKTKFNVYYGDKKIDAMASSFKEIGDGYAKDAFNVFYYGKKIDGASASTFKYTGDGYAQDAFNAYYRGRKLD